jgi:hypothetical protein
VAIGDPASGDKDSDENEVVLLSSGENGCTFEVKIPELDRDEVEIDGRTYDRFHLSRYGSAGAVGGPELLARHVRVAAPPEADVSVTVERVSYDVMTGVKLCPRPRLEAEERHGEQQLREVFEFDAQSYRDGVYPSRFAELAGQDIVRGYRLLSVAVMPYQYDAKTATLKVAKSVVVRVSFAGGVRRANTRYPARPAEEGIFSRTIPSIVVNWEDAAAWPFAGGLAPALDAGIWPTDFADKAAMKIVVEKEGLYRLTYEELDRAGYPVSTWDPRNLRLYTGPAQSLPRDFFYEPDGLTEIPLYVAGEGDGRFDAGDYVEFFGHGCDFFKAVTPNENGSFEFSKDRFTRYNVYWLVAGDDPGKRMTDLAVPPAGGTRPTYFWHRIRVEEDNQDKAEGETEYDMDDEFWYWRTFNAPYGPSALAPFSVPDPVSTSNAPPTHFQMMVREEKGYGTLNGPHNTFIYLNYGTPEREIFKAEDYSARPETFLRGTFATRLLLNGQNRVYFEEKDPTGERSVIALDHFEFEYPRYLRADENYIRFSNLPEHSGDILFEVKGFTTDDLVLYDVTRGRRLTAFDVQAEGNEYTLRFTDNIPSGRRFYVAATSTVANRKPVDYYLDAGSRLRDVDENVDMIVVVYDGFYDNVMPLVNQRRAEGLNVVVARVSDVYDEYSWGLYDPGAVRHIVKDYYRKAIYRPGGTLPDHLLLVGDAFTDHRDNLRRFVGKKLWREYGRNLVPTYYVRSSSSGRAASDNVFVSMSESEAPDLAVGRLSAPFEENIDAIVDKIVGYRRDAVNGPWNSRVVLCADNDDKVSSGGGGGFFTRDNEELEADFVPQGYEARKLNIEWLNRRFNHDTFEKKYFDELDRGVRKKHVDDYLRPDLRRSFDALIVHFAGHGGPQVWAHEDLLVHHKNKPPIDDIYYLENYTFLPVVIQCSCSTCYFDQWVGVIETNPLDYGQSISEYLLQQPRTAAVASMGSTRLGTEGGQKKFLEGFYGHLFPNQALRNAGVTVGEAHFVGKVEAADDTITRMFTLLGDPSMTLAIPRPGLVLTPNRNTVARGGTFRVSGTVPNNFNGKATVSLFDRPWYFYSYDNSYDVYRDRLLSSTEVEVVNGRFEATVVVPVVPENPVPEEVDSVPVTTAAAATDSAEAATDAEGRPAAPPAGVATPYTDSSLEDVAEDGVAYIKAVAYGNGFRQTYVCNESVTINVSGEVNSSDVAGPDVDIYLEDYSFRSGDATGPTPELLVDLRDDSGVLVARNLEAIAPGETTYVPLYVTVDQEAPLDLTYYYKPEEGDYRAGSVTKKLALGEGNHRITVTAHDGLGNRTERTVNCVVSGSLALTEVMNCPNPFADDTYFTLVTSTDVDSLVVKIYTATGRLIQKIEAGGIPAGYHQIYWDGRDREGDAIANGVYFYKIIARAGDQKIVAREKLVKLR